MGLRIGIDVGGTFTHGVVLEPPGSVIARARTPTTHADQRGVAAGIAEVLRQLLDELERLEAAGAAHGGRAAVELVAHSTTQATNALLEGDLSGVHLLAIVPPGERALVSRALRQRSLDIGGGHSIRLWPKLMEDWRRATPEEYPDEIGGAAISGRQDAGKNARATALASLPEPAEGRPGWEGFGIPPGFWVSEQLPVAVVQPLAGKHENREQHVAAHYRACGHPTVAAGEITQVLGLQARARTAVVNAAMLPTMLATAEYTEKVVRELLPGVPLQVVRSDGGAMTIDEMRRQPILSLLSGPAAGASAALHRSGLSDAVFIEVGGTSTDITLIKDGRVRHRYATVGGQRLMVPALDLRTVAVGGGSMLRADTGLFGPRSAHIAGFPYLFQAAAAGLRFEGVQIWQEAKEQPEYLVAVMSDGSLAAFTLTDAFVVMNGSAADSELAIQLGEDERSIVRNALRGVGERNTWQPNKKWMRKGIYTSAVVDQLSGRWDEDLDDKQLRQLLRQAKENMRDVEGKIREQTPLMRISHAFVETCTLVANTIRELASANGIPLEHLKLVAGGGGGPVIANSVAGQTGLLHRNAEGQVVEFARLIPDHAVISAIGAALAVTCVSISRHCAQPSGGDIAELIDEVERRLAAQGAERVQTDYEFDPRRQVLTVTGRGSRPYDQDATVHSEDEQRDIVRNMLNADPALAWHDDGTRLWMVIAPSSHKRPSASLACSTDRFGRVLWLGKLAALEVAPAGRIAEALDSVTARHTQHTDGGAVLPHLGLLTGGRYIPLDQLGSAELIAEVLRWEKLPSDAEGCFVVGKD